ncbi:hypothetical protein Tco_0912469 [Tanacetum coccineum]
MYSNFFIPLQRVPQVYPRCPARMFTPTGPTSQTHYGDLMANNPMPAHSADALLKSQLNRVVVKEDYEDAARIKVAIAAAATNNTVGRVMAQLNKAIKEERYKDASFIRDYASAGLHVLMLMKDPRESDASDPIAPLELPHSLHAVRCVSQPDALKEVSFQAYHNGSDYHLSEQRLMSQKDKCHPVWGLVESYAAGRDKKLIGSKFGRNMLTPSENCLGENPAEHARTAFAVDPRIAFSLAILEYIDETWNSSTRFLPEDPLARATSLFWAKFSDDQHAGN